MELFVIVHEDTSRLIGAVGRCGPYRAIEHRAGLREAYGQDRRCMGAYKHSTRVKSSH
jgi:hypothetical protein